MLPVAPDKVVAPNLFDIVVFWLGVVVDGVAVVVVVGVVVVDVLVVVV